jgi:hypothetical protein
MRKEVDILLHFEPQRGEWVSKFSVLAPRILLICQRFHQDSRLPQNQCTYLCRRASKVEAHFTGWQCERPRDRSPPDSAGAVNTQNELAGRAVR